MTKRILSTKTLTRKPATNRTVGLLRSAKPYKLDLAVPEGGAS